MSGGSGKTENTSKNELTNATTHGVESVNRNESAALNPWEAASQDVQALPGLARNLYYTNPSGLGATTTSALTGLSNKADSFAAGVYGPNATDVAKSALIAGIKDKTLRDRSNAIWNDRSSAESNLGDVAAGKYLGGANPYLDELIARSAQDATNQVAGRFAASGRYGSGAFANSLADTTGRIATEARMQDYEQERARQAQAAAAIDSAKMAREGLAGNTYQAFLNNRLAMGSAAPGLDQALQTLNYMPYLTKLGAGQIQDEAPWKSLGLYEGAVGPLAQTFGTQKGTMEGQSVRDEHTLQQTQGQSRTKTQTEESPLKTILGGASLLAGLFGGPMGAGALSATGGLTSLLGGILGGKKGE